MSGTMPGRPNMATAGMAASGERQNWKPLAKLNQRVDAGHRMRHLGVIFVEPVLTSTARVRALFCVASVACFLGTSGIRSTA
jgi:hypothetical protein